MKMIDLTQLMCENMPVYPGTGRAIIKTQTTIEEHGYKEALIHIFSHTGTHIDCPAHIISNGAEIEDLPIDTFFGKAMVVDCRSCEKNIELERIKVYEEQIQACEFILFCTGWNSKWSTENYFTGFPIPSAEVLEYLTTFKLKGIGIDAISIDPVGDTVLLNHRKVFEKNIIIIENLTNLEKLLHTDFILSCFPLRLITGDGSPVRAVAIL